MIQMTIKQFLIDSVQRTKGYYEENQKASVWTKKILYSPWTFLSSLLRFFVQLLSSTIKEKFKDQVISLSFIAVFSYLLYSLVLGLFVLILNAFSFIVSGHLLVALPKYTPDWQQVIAIVSRYPIVPLPAAVGLLVNMVIYYCLTIWLVMLTISIVQLIMGPGKIASKYIDSQFYFSDQEYDQAVEVLEGWKRCNYQKAVAKHGERIVDLLFLASALYKDRFWQIGRAVALNSIKEDRAARDDEE